jgi:hypothetical protein
VIVVHAVCVPDVGSDRRVGRGRRPVPECAGPALDPAQLGFDGASIAENLRTLYDVITAGASLALEREAEA